MFSNLSSESHTQPQQLNDKQQAMKLKLQQWNNNPPKIWGILTNTSKNERKKKKAEFTHVQTFPALNNTIP